MTTNRLLIRAFAPLLVLGAVLFNTGSVNAQTTQNFPVAAVQASGSGVTASAQAGGSDLTNAARLSSTLVTNNRFVTLNWATPIPANTPVYIKVATETTLLQGLLGGALGNVVTNLSAILLDGQYITVTALNSSSATINSASSNSATVNDITSTLKVVQDVSGNYYIKFIPTGDASYITITNVRTGVTGVVSRWIDVYGAYYTSGSGACANGNYTSFTGGGLLSADLTAGRGLVEGYKAIDNSNTTFSKLNLGTLGVAASIEQNVYFEGVSTATDKYKIKLRLAPGLLTVNVLNSIYIRGYRGNSATAAFQASATTLLTPDLLGLLQSNTPVVITISPNQIIDRISIGLTGVANINLTQEVEIYSVTRGDFTVTTTGTGNYRTDQTATLAAVVNGCSTYTYSWSDGLGSIQSVTAPTDVVGTRTYTVTVTDNFGFVKTATATVTVLPAPVAGTIAGGSAVCYGEIPGSLTLSGHTGTIARWEKADNDSFTNATAIANTTTTLAGAELGPLTQTTYVRAVIQRNGYPDAHPTATFTVKTSTWNGTAWSPLAPDINTYVRFTGAYSASTNLSACALEVTNGAVVNIPSGNTITVNGYVHVLDGSFTLQHNAHLVQLTDAVNLGNITQIRNSQPLYRLDYTLWSAPVTGQLMQPFSPATVADRFFDYYYALNTANNQMLEGYWPVNPATTSFQPGHSYLIRMPNNNAAPGYNAGTSTLVFAGPFTGVPNNGTIQRPLSTLNFRYTPVGNPYPSPINVRAFFNANASVLQTGSTLYFWRKKNNSNASSYATLSRDAYVSNKAIGGNAGEELLGGEQWDNFFNSDVAPTEWVINPGQGFIVKTASGLTNPQVTFTNAMRRDVHNSQFFRTAEPETLSRYWLEMKGSNSYSQLAVVYSNTATLDLDAGRDAMIMGENNLGFYSIAAATNLTIQARPEFAQSDIVPLGFKALNGGQYTINIARKDSAFDNQRIFIRDNAEGVTRELGSNVYTFTTAAGTFNDRFEIIYTTTALSTENAAATPKTVMIYKTDNTINVNAGTSLINSVKVYDMRGRVLYQSAEKINDVTAQVNGLSAQTQILLVEVNTVNGTITKKIAY